MMRGRFIAFLAVTGMVAEGAAAPAAKDAFQLSSPDLPEGKPIAETFMANAFGCQGPNLSPALKWEHAPAGTRSFVITLFDPYKPPVSGWWHWVVYDIPATTSQLPRDAGHAGNAKLPTGAKQLRPDGEAPEAHYYGPCPDEGDPAHHYTFTVYALSVEHLDVPPTSTPANLDYVIASKTLAKASLVRLFSRGRKTP